MADHASFALSILILSIAATVWVKALPSLQFQAEPNPLRRDFYGLTSPGFFGPYLNDRDATKLRDRNNLGDDQTRQVRPSPTNSQARRNLDYLFGSATYLVDDPDEQSPYSKTIALLPSDRELLERFVKRNIDEIDRTAFDNFFKRNLDEIDRVGWSGFVKRMTDYLTTGIGRTNVLPRRG